MTSDPQPPFDVATLMAHTAGLYALSDASGQLTYVNPRWTQVLGLTPDQLTEEVFLDLVHPADRAHTFDVFSRMLSGTPVARFHNRYRHADGHWVWLEWSAARLPDGRLFGCARDVSRPPETPHPQDDSRRLLDLAEELAQVGHWSIDSGNRSVTLSDNLSALLGLPRHFVASGHDEARALRIWVPEDRPRIAEVLSRSRESEGPFTFEGRARLGDGRIRTLRVVGETTGARPPVLRGVVLDVTDQQEAVPTPAPHDLSRRLGETSLVCAEVAHELRNQLQAGRATLDLLRTAPLTDGQVDLLQTLGFTLETMERLAGDLHDTASALSGRVRLTLAPVSPRRLLEHAHALHLERAQAKGLDLRLEVDGLLPPRVLVDRARVVQVLSNLLGNAIKFTDEGHVTLRAHAEVSTPGRTVWHLSVEDSGIGIPTSRLDAVFDRFAQGGAEIRRRRGGSGLGLSVCRALVEAMGGRIGVTSMLGEGTRFGITLPVDEVASEAPTPSRAPLRSQQPQTGSRRVLIVDDHAVVRSLLSRLVHSLGHEAEVAATADEARSLAATTLYDAVLIDLDLPDDDGDALARSLHRPERRPWLVCISGDPPRSEAASASFDASWVKPIDRTRLATLLGDASAPSTLTGSSRAE